MPAFQCENGVDLVYVNGVSHQVLMENRIAVVEQVNHFLRAQGLLSFWENNP
jgi:hypothetical protein